MDWGLAKVLPRGGVGRRRRPARPAPGDGHRHGAQRLRRPACRGRVGAGHAGLHGARAGPRRGRPAGRAGRRLRGWARSSARSSPASRRSPAEPRARSSARRRGRHGRRPGPAGRLRGRPRAGRAGARTAWRASRRTARATPATGRADHGLPGGRAGAAPRRRVGPRRRGGPAEAAELLHAPRRPTCAERRARRFQAGLAASLLALATPGVLGFAYLLHQLAAAAGVARALAEAMSLARRGRAPEMRPNGATALAATGAPPRAQGPADQVAPSAAGRGRPGRGRPRRPASAGPRGDPGQ